MKHITILIPDGQNNLSSMVGALKILTRANQYQQVQSGKSQVKITLAGLSKEVILHDGWFSVHPERLSKIKKTNLIIIPSMNHNFVEGIELNKKMIPWIIRQHGDGAEIASICTGAFLLASTGLIDGKECATHWSAGKEFKSMFPNVNLVSDKIITHENRIYTNGGAFSFLNLILYLVERYFDRQTAIYCSKVFQIDPERHSQSPFAIFSGTKDHDDAEIRKAQAILEKSGSKKISVPDLASRLAVGRRNFDRRFKKATGTTPVEYLQRVRIEAAKNSLERSSKTVSEVMYDVGYNDAKAFREIFKKISGMSPGDYKKRFNKTIQPRE
jgi:transcriptional regulator GlxA family with amidase domain